MTSAACSATFIRTSELELGNAVGDDLTFFGAYAFDAFPDDAEAIVIFERPEALGGSTGMGYIVNDTGVVALHYGCGWTLENFVENNDLGEPIASPD